MYQLRRVVQPVRVNAAVLRTFSSTNAAKKIGFVGLGHMGSKMALNLYQDGHSVVLFDPDTRAVKNTVTMISESAKTSQTVESVASVAELAARADVGTIVSMLPNDAVSEIVSNELLTAVKGLGSQGKTLVHVNCSTISPALAESLEKQHAEVPHSRVTYIAAPVFARPDGITKRQAVFMVSGATEAREHAKSLLAPMGRIEDFGENVSAGNVAKLCGNYLIAASIEAISETMVFAEKHGVDREQVMTLLNTSIFDCLIYKGYGQRVSQRDHRPGGFALELGYKDVTLVQQAARRTKVPMPFLSVLCDRYTAARAKGREALDWSAIALNVAEDGGLDVQPDLKRNFELLRVAQEAAAAAEPQK